MLFYPVSSCALLSSLQMNGLTCRVLNFCVFSSLMVPTAAADESGEAGGDGDLASSGAGGGRGRGRGVRAAAARLGGGGCERVTSRGDTRGAVRVTRRH